MAGNSMEIRRFQPPFPIAADSNCLPHGSSGYQHNGGDHDHGSGAYQHDGSEYQYDSGKYGHSISGYHDHGISEYHSGGDDYNPDGDKHEHEGHCTRQSHNTMTTAAVDSSTTMDSVTMVEDDSNAMTVVDSTMMPDTMTAMDRNTVADSTTMTMVMAAQ